MERIDDTIFKEISSQAERNRHFSGAMERCPLTKPCGELDANVGKGKENQCGE